MSLNYIENVNLLKNKKANFNRCRIQVIKFMTLGSIECACKVTFYLVL